MGLSIIEEVLQKEGAAAAEVERRQRELEQQLSEETRRAEAEASEKFSTAQEQNRYELEQMEKTLDRQLKKSTEKLDAELSAMQNVPEKKIETVARQVVDALKHGN